MTSMRLNRHLAAAGLIGLAAVWSAAQAQTVYRIVGPDGKVTFSDRPPVEANAKAAPANVGGGTSAASDTSLPFELRQVAGRYPVTLYSAPNCGPCDSGRAFLSTRGIPFAERTVTTQQDIEALNRMSSAGSLPLLSVGGQQLKGYSEAEWGQFLDAAGYPKSSQLPPGYRQQAAAPLVVVQQPGVAANRQPNGQPRADAGNQPQAAPPPNPNNPAGIQF
jgi:glutaredoxin